MQPEITAGAAVKRLHAYICTTGKVMFGKTQLFVIGSGDNLGEFYKQNPDIERTIKNFGGIVKFCSKYPAFLKYFILETKASKKHMVQALSVGAKVEPFLDEGKFTEESSNIAEKLHGFLQENSARYPMLRFSEVAAFYGSFPNAKDIIYNVGGLSRFVTTHYELFRHVTEYKGSVMQYGVCIVDQFAPLDEAEYSAEGARSKSRNAAISSAFDESLYTKPLDLKSFSAEQIMRAEKLAIEIEGDNIGPESPGYKCSPSGDSIPETEKSAIRADMKQYLSKQNGRSMRMDRYRIIIYQYVVKIWL
jgi:hypothetical protein